VYFELIAEAGHEQVVFCQDGPSGLRAIVAIHSTALGPALGGCRFHPYETEQDAVTDVLRLAEGMTLKAAAAGLDLGGGKAVIIGDPHRDKTEVLLRAYARHVDSLGGRYITAEDVGTYREDMDLIRRETRWVTGISPTLGGSDDPSPVTAVGVWHAMRAAAADRWGDASLRGRRVAVQGVGKVGRELVSLLVREGVAVVVADPDVDAVAAVCSQENVDTVPPGEILSSPCDILAPCAMGGVLTHETAATVKAEIICGSANNQLDTTEVADELSSMSILYVPDFICNAGGLINVAMELGGAYDRKRALERVAGIERMTHQVLHRARELGISTDAAARRLAGERIEQISRLRLIRGVQQ